MPNGKQAFQASWILPVDQPPIENGFLCIEDGKIIATSKSLPSGWQSPVRQLDDTLILPGLVNAHTHLEFSNFAKPLGEPGIEFTDWIRLVVQSRRDAVGAADFTSAKNSALKTGLAETLATGSIAIGEIATAPIIQDTYADCQLSVVLFRECLGRNPDTVNDTMADLLKDQSQLQSKEFEFGFSPHAPYSVHPELMQQIVAAANSKTSIAMHLAESPAELELMKSIDGPFVPLLKELNAWHPDTYRANDRPMNYLQAVSTCARVLIVHGNYLDGSELDFVATKASSMNIVFCPRTHHFFRHKPYPLHEMLDRGICVAVGTDSRASTPDLKLLEELKLISASFPELDPAKILELGTINGARALGLDSTYGSLKPGKSARVCTVRCSNVDDPWQALFAKDAVAQPLDLTEIN